MFRLLAVGLIALIGILGGDLLFRTSLVRAVHPVIIAPTDGETVDPPVRLEWEGPRRMLVTLRYAGRNSWNLGIHESPFEIPKDHLRERGLYSVQISAPVLGRWINADRAFAIKPPAPQTPESDETMTLGNQIAALRRSIAELQSAQDEMKDENGDLYEENASVREENAVLTEELNRLADAEQRAQAQAATVQQDHDRLVQEHRALLDEIAQLRQRLAAVIPCTVWGYFSYPHPQTIPVSRRVVTVSDTQGEIFRSQRGCEVYRQGDPGNASPCFCVGSSWGDQ